SEWGEVVVAAYEGRVQPDPLREWLKTRLAPHEVPKRLVQFDRLPEAGGGEPDRGAVRAELAAVLRGDLAEFTIPGGGAGASPHPACVSPPAASAVPPWSVGSVDVPSRAASPLPVARPSSAGRRTGSAIGSASRPLPRSPSTPTAPRCASAGVRGWPWSRRRRTATPPPCGTGWRAGRLGHPRS